ncbi:TIGR02808 family protein [Parendozoicomonas sp. Alg238-R29]|nr:TIGR02808 family protein [Parendozoicomonas sp. Alg238-R29]
MSSLEWLIWNILGYATMPMIFLAGFAGTALVACILMDLFKIKSISEE